MTTEKVREPREFWVWKFKFGPNESVSQECLVSTDPGGSDWIDTIHVVEASALTAAQERVAELESILKKQNELIEYWFGIEPPYGAARIETGQYRWEQKQFRMIDFGKHLAREANRREGEGDSE